MKNFKKRKPVQLRISQDLASRFIRVETLLEEHLRAHGKIQYVVLYPSLVGIILLVVKVYFLKG